jgi:hypothetical protein
VPVRDDDAPSVLDDEGPTDEELATLVAEEPLIAAGIALVDAQIRALTAEGGPTALDLLRVRRARARVARETAAYAALRVIEPVANLAA